MSSPYPIAALFGALLFVMRHEPTSLEHQIPLLRVIRALIEGGPLRIDARLATLRINGERIPFEAPGARFLSEQLLLHEFGSLLLPADISDEDLLRLAVVLAAFPGTYPTYAEASAALGATASRISLTRDSSEFEAEPERISQAATLLASEQSGDQELHRFHSIELDPASARASDDVDIPLSGAFPEERPSVERLLRQAWGTTDRQDWDGLLDIAVQIVDGENDGTFGLTGSMHRIEFKRLMSRRNLAMIARFTHSDRKQEAITVLRQFGTDAAEVLMELLVDAPNMMERRGYYSALVQMSDGTAVIIQHLSHRQWYVVRNAADLCGELTLADSVVPLSRQMRHPDERVRKSVAEALGKIGTPVAIESLARMLPDTSAAVRMQAVSHLSGRRVRGMSLPISELLNREEDAGVQREALLALGRIGSPEALAVLADWVSGGGKGARRRATPVRLTAIRALALAGPAAVDILATLERDTTPEVREAAAQALSILRR